MNTSVANFENVEHCCHACWNSSSVTVLFHEVANHIQVISFFPLVWAAYYIPMSSCQRHDGALFAKKIVSWCYRYISFTHTLPSPNTISPPFHNNDSHSKLCFTYYLEYPRVHITVNTFKLLPHTFVSLSPKTLMLYHPTSHLTSLYSYQFYVPNPYPKHLHSILAWSDVPLM